MTVACGAGLADSSLQEPSATKATATGGRRVIPQCDRLRRGHVMGLRSRRIRRINGAMGMPDLREPAYAFTVFIYGRKKDKLSPLPRASLPRKTCPTTTHNRNPAEPEGASPPCRRVPSVSIAAIRFSWLRFERLHCLWLLRVSPRFHSLPCQTPPPSTDMKSLKWFHSHPTG